MKTPLLALLAAFLGLTAFGYEVESVWYLRFANGRQLVAAGRPCRTNGEERVWDLPEARVSVRTSRGPDFTDYTATVTPRAGEIVEVDLPYKLRFPAVAGTRLVVPQGCQDGPGLALNERFFQTDGAVFEPGFSFMDYLHLTTAAGGALAVFGVQHRPYLKSVPVCGADARGGWLCHRCFPYVRTGETRILPSVRLLRGVENRAAVARYAEANGIVRTLADKFPKAKLETLLRAPLLLVSGSRATDCERIVPALPVPVLFHTASYLAGGFDKQYPDLLPPNPERFGTAAEFRSLIDALHARGHLFMPYTNPTWWCDNPPGPSFRKFGTAPVCRRADGSLVREEYAPGNTGYCVSQWHPAVRAASERVAEAFTRDFPSDLLFQDQCGNRGNTLDFNPAAPSPDAYIEGMLRRLEADAARVPLGTEDAWDRAADIETALFGACWKLVATPGEGTFHARKVRDRLPPGTWTLEPISLYLMHHRALFWMHDLGQFVTNRRILAWMAALGYNLSFCMTADAIANDRAQVAWFRTLADLQRTAFSRIAGQPLLAYRHTPGAGGRRDDGAVEARYGAVEVKVNLGDRPRSVGGETLEPYGWRIGETRSDRVLPPLDEPLAPPVPRREIALLRMAEPLTTAWTKTPPETWATSLRAFSALHGLAYREIASPEALLETLTNAPAAHVAIVNPYGENFPVISRESWPSALAALADFLRRGGWWFETGGYSFHHVVFREKGTWNRQSIGEKGARSIGFHVILGPISEDPETLLLSEGAAVGAGEGSIGKATVNRPLSELPVERVKPLVRDVRGRVWFGFHPQGAGRLYRVGGAYPPFELLWPVLSESLLGRFH